MNDRSAAAPREPGDTPERFLIPAAQVPRGLVERLEGGYEPATPRPAATVVLARDGEAGPEVLLVRRPRRSSFAADAWVFPGGVVDAEDAAPQIVAGDAHGWAARLGLSDAEGAIAYVVAALREAFEETGILLSDPPLSRRAARAARRRLLADESKLPELLRAHGARLDPGSVSYIAHWITPEPEPRRYDTRFFLAPVPPDHECELVGGELVEFGWVRPDDAVAAYTAGAMRLLPPTVDTLRRLAGRDSVRSLQHAVAELPVETRLPRMRRHPRGVLIEIGAAPADAERRPSTEAESA